MKKQRHSYIEDEHHVLCSLHRISSRNKRAQKGKQRQRAHDLRNYEFYKKCRGYCFLK